MQALVYDDFKVPPTLRTVPDPTPPPRGVVLRVHATGLCRSDWHGWQGHDPMINPPHVPGHEVAGTIVEVGTEVRQWTQGDRVTVPFVAGCGQCAQCRAGQPHVCPAQYQPGFSGWGTFAEYVALDYADHNLVALPDALDNVTAASLGCRFATAFRAVVDQGSVRPGDWVAVHGCGGVGLSAVMIADAMGAQVVAVDISEPALSRAEALGATHTLHVPSTDDIPAAIRERTDGGAHVSLDAVGTPTTAHQSVGCLRIQGCHLQVGLLLEEHADTALPMDQVVAHELEVRGVHGLPQHRYPALLSLVASGRVQPDCLVERTISLDAAGAALASMNESGAPGITVVDSLP